MDEQTPRYTNLRDYGRMLRKQWLVIVIPVVIAVAAALAFSLHQTATYDAEAQVLIQDETQQLALLGSSAAPSSTAAGTAAIVAQTVSTPALAASVRRKLRTRIPAADLMGAVSLSVDSTTGLLDVRANSGTARFAAALANAYAARIAGVTTGSVRRQLAIASRTLKQRLSQLRSTAGGVAGERANLLDDISRLEFLQATGAPGQVVRAATPPASPASPRPARNVGLGLIAGLLIGLIAAFLREAFDRRMRGSTEIADQLGLRLVGHVHGKSLGKAIHPDMGSRRDLAGDVETFRILRTNVELLLGEHPRRSVLVTSALPEEGKSTVAASLALASAAAGRKTLLLEADLRRPSLAERLGIPSSPGLSDYLLGLAEASTVVRSVHVQGAGARIAHGATSNGHNGNSTGNGYAARGGLAAIASANLSCLPAGQLHGGSAELLASTRMRELLDDVMSAHDVVILDTAPLLPVADTLPLLSQAGAVILCVRSGQTTHEQTEAAREALVRVAPEITGVVVTDVRPRDEAGGRGLYPYRYSSERSAG
jgi:polysaccharide biosynthesis transport protein